MLDPRMEPLIEQYLPLAQALAQQVHRTAPHRLEFEELRAIAWSGLVDAADRWHPYCAKYGYSPDAVQYFRPFVVRRVYGSLIDAIRAADWANRAVRARARTLEQAGHGRGVSDTELARRTGMSVSEVRGTLQRMAAQPVSLEGKDLDPSGSHNVESSVLAQAILDSALTVIRALPEDQRYVVVLHYHQGLKLQEIARELGISESRTSQIHAEAVLAIHAAMRAAASGDNS